MGVMRPNQKQADVVESFGWMKPVGLSKAFTTPDEYEPEMHTVLVGEDLETLAAKYGVSVDQLKQWNNFHRDKAEPGKMIRVR